MTTALRLCSAVLAAAWLCLAGPAAAGTGAQVINVRAADMELMRAVEDQSFIALEILGGGLHDDDPETIVRAIDEHFVEVQAGRRDLHWDEWNETYAPLGALWGEQICFRYDWDWYWVWLDGDEGAWRYALMPADHSLILLPFDHLMDSVREGRTVAVHRIFAAIGHNPALDGFAPGAYVDLAANPALLVWENE